MGITRKCRNISIFWQIFLPLARPGVATLALFTFTAPNTQQFMARFRPGLPSSPGRRSAPLRRLEWQARPAWSLVMVAALLLALSRMSGVSPFLYYQF